MLSAITSVTFFQQILIRDVLDIAVIAILIYTCIRLLRETHSTPVFAGVITIVALYILSKSLGLPITESVLRTFLSTFLVVLAVVFQKELRRFFSFFGFFKIGKIPTPPNDEVIQTVSSTVFELIQRKLGALIVFPGHESIARVVEGGYELGGEVSEPILLSIFDETSPGHDGAVVIQNNIIATFGVHLPLADQIEKVRQFGLRHRAALGLSERSDAMVIVVSQEKGKVSVAYRGAIRHVAGEQELIEILTSFYREKFPRSDMAHIMRWVGKNASLILVSVIVSVVVWVAVRINGI
jgi:uncharacterized protein (TIGR00159 family)